MTTTSLRHPAAPQGPFVCRRARERGRGPGGARVARHCSGRAPRPCGRVGEAAARAGGIGPVRPPWAPRLRPALGQNGLGAGLKTRREPVTRARAAPPGERPAPPHRLRTMGASPGSSLLRGGAGGKRPGSEPGEASGPHCAKPRGPGAAF